MTLGNASQIDCIGDQACKDGGTRTCGQYAVCEANCDGQLGSLACGSVYFDARQATGYQMWCVAQEDCSQIEVHCPPSGSCIINCGANEQGADGSGGAHCKEAIIDCGTADCTINCKFSDSCENMIIKNGNSVTCNGFCSPTSAPTTSTPTSTTPSSIGLIQPLPDGAFSASSVFNDAHAPYRAKFNSLSAWGPNVISTQQWLRIDLGAAYVITKIATKGNANVGNINSFDEWVKEYGFFVSLDGNNFVYNDTFTGNYDINSVVEHIINPSVTAQYVEFHPTLYQGWPSMRVEIYGYLSGQTSAPTTTTENPTAHPTDSPTNHPSRYPTTATPTTDQLVDRPTEPPTTAADGEARNTIDNTLEKGDTKTNDTSSGMDTVTILLIVISILVVVILIGAVGCCIYFKKKKNSQEKIYDNSNHNIEIGNIVPNDGLKTGTDVGNNATTNAMKRIVSASLSGERENLNETGMDMNENENENEDTDTDTHNDMYNHDEITPNINESPGSLEITPGSNPTAGNIGADFMDINQNENNVTRGTVGSDEGDILNEDENMDEMYDINIKGNKSQTSGKQDANVYQTSGENITKS